MELTLDHRPAYFDLVGEDYEVVENIRGHLTFRLINDDVVMTGRLATKIRMKCIRCLEPVEIPIDREVNLVFLPRAKGKEPGEMLNPGEEETSFYSGHTIYPGEDIRELILIDLPDYPLCRPSCLGLCPHCGADLNRGDCGCPPDTTPPEPESKSWKDKIKKIHLS